MFDKLKFNNPIVFGIGAAAVIYLYLYLEQRKKNIALKAGNKQGIFDSVSVKLPIIVGILVWGATNYFSGNKIMSGGSYVAESVDSQDIFLSMADF